MQRKTSQKQIYIYPGTCLTLDVAYKGPFYQTVESNRNFVSNWNTQDVSDHTKRRQNAHPNVSREPSPTQHRTTDASISTALCGGGGVFVVSHSGNLALNLAYVYVQTWRLRFVVVLSSR